MQNHHLTAATIILFIIVAAAIVLYGIKSGWNYELVRTTISSFGIWAPLIFMLLYSVVSVFLPVTPFIIMSGLLFGPLWGTVYAVLAGLIGAIITFTSARILGKPWVEKKLEKQEFSFLARYNSYLDSSGLSTVTILRLIPLIPSNGLSLALGVTKVSVFNYTLGTVLGIIPSTVILAYFGGSIYSWPVEKIAIVSAVIIILLALPPFYHRYYKKISTESSPTRTAP